MGNRLNIYSNILHKYSPDDIIPLMASQFKIVFRLSQKHA